jgi:hypothetical protein
VTSSVLVQKQVGQTIVQLPQVRQRLATSFQCGDSRFSRSRFGRSTSGMARPMDCSAAVTASAASATSAGVATWCGTSAMIRAPAGLATSTTKR